MRSAPSTLDWRHVLVDLAAPNQLIAFQTTPGVLAWPTQPRATAALAREAGEGPWALTRHQARGAGALRGAASRGARGERSCRPLRINNMCVHADEIANVAPAPRLSSISSWPNPVYVIVRRGDDVLTSTPHIIMARLRRSVAADSTACRNYAAPSAYIIEMSGIARRVIIAMRSGESPMLSVLRID